MVLSDIRRHKIMEEALRSIMGASVPPSFKFEDTYDSIVFPQGYTVPAQATVEAKFNELLALEDDEIKTTFKGDLEVGTANLYVDVSESSVGIGTSSPNATLQVVGNVHVSSNLEVRSKFIVDTDTGYVGIGTTTPDTSLQVIGNVYTSSNLQVGDNFIVDTTTSRVGVSTTIPNNILEVTGNTYISSNLEVGGTFFVDTTTNRVGIGTTTPDANLHVEGDVYISNGGTTANGGLRLITGRNIVGVGGVLGSPSANLEVGGNAYVSSDLRVGSTFTVDKKGNVGIDVTNPDAALTVDGRIHTKKGRYIFDLENTRPEYYPTRNDDDRHICMADTNFNHVSLPNTNVRKYVPSTGTDSSVSTNTGSNPELTTSVSAVAGEEWYQEGGSLYISPGVNSNGIHKMVPFSAAGRIFGFYNNRSEPIAVYLYAPYDDDVEVKIYMNRSINSEDPEFTLTLTKQTVTSQVLRESGESDQFTCIIEASSPILASRFGDPNANNTDQQIMYPLSDLSYNYYRQSTTLTTTNQSDIFSNAYGYTSLSIIRSGAAFHCPNGACSTQTFIGDGDGGNMVMSIPYEMLSTTYYVAHTIGGYVLVATSEDPIQVTAYTNANGTTGDNYSITSPLRGGTDPYNPQEFRRGNVGSIGTSLSTTNRVFWKFTSNSPFALRVEVPSTDGDDEYWAWGKTKTTGGTPVYRLPYSPKPLIYKAYFNSFNANAGSYDTAYSPGLPSIFNFTTSYSNEISDLYGTGFTVGGNYIQVPSSGLYKIHFNIGFSKPTFNGYRNCVAVGFVANAGSTATLDGMKASTAYIRDSSEHESASCSGTFLASIGGGATESTTIANYDDFKITIQFFRLTSDTSTVNIIPDTSFVIVEKIT